MTDPIPVRGDRAAWDDIGYPGLHGKDLDSSAPLYHLPTPGDVGDVPKWNGSMWIAGPAGNADWYQTVIVDAAGNGDYTTVKGALDYVATQTRTDPWMAYVNPGKYNEDPFTIPSNTHVVGVVHPGYLAQSPVSIFFSATSGVCITMNRGTSIIGCELNWGYAVLTGPSTFIKFAVSGYHTLRFCNLYLSPETTSSSDQVEVFDSAAGMGFLFNVDMDDMVTNPDDNPNVCIFRVTTSMEVKNTFIMSDAANHYAAILTSTGNLETWGSYIGSRFSLLSTGVVRVYGQYGRNHYGGGTVLDPNDPTDIIWEGDSNSTLICGIPVAITDILNGEGLVYQDGSFVNASSAGASTLAELDDVAVSEVVSNRAFLVYDTMAGAWVDRTFSPTPGGILWWNGMIPDWGCKVFEAHDFDYTPSDNTDWDGDADPGQIDDALDQLAGRVQDLEDIPPGSPDASDVTYTPTVDADWDADTDPGNVDNALDQLAERVTDIEEGASGGDMTKAVYDSNDDGKVDEADIADAVPWSGVTGKPSMQAMFQVYGDLTTGEKDYIIPNAMGRSVTISKVYLIAKTGPTGADVIVDIHKSGTTIFTTQSNRPVIAAGATSGYTTTIEVPTWADGEYLTVCIDQIGSTIAGANVTVVIVYA